MILEMQVQIWKYTFCMCNLVFVEISSWMYTKQHLQICGYGFNHAYKELNTTMLSFSASPLLWISLFILLILLNEKMLQTLCTCL